MFKIFRFSIFFLLIQTDTGIPKTSTSLDIKPTNGPNGISPSSPQSADSNSNVPSSSHSTLQSLVQSSRSNQIDSHITPSISLIPIKQVKLRTKRKIKEMNSKSFFFHFNNLIF